VKIGLGCGCGGAAHSRNVSVLQREPMSVSEEWEESMIKYYLVFLKDYFFKLVT